MGEWQRFAFGHGQLPGHQILPGHRFGDRMLHLQPGVHLHKEELILAEQELDGASPLIMDGFGCGHGCLPHGAAQSRRDVGGGRLFDHLLMASLQGAVPVPQIDGVAEAIGKDLYFHVASQGQIALEQYQIVTKGSLGFPFDCRQRLVKVSQLIDPAHPLATAATGRFDKQREANQARLIAQEVRSLIRAVIAGQHRYTGRLHQRLGPRFVAHGENGGAAWADKAQAALFAGGGKIAVFRQKAVTGMDGIGARLFGNLQHPAGVQIALSGRCWPQMPGLIGQTGVHGVGVGIGVEGDGVNAEAFRRLDDTHGNFAAIGNQQALNLSVMGHVSSLKRGRQAGGRLSKKACIPSWASSPTRTRAMVSTVFSSCRREGWASIAASSRLVSFIASGPLRHRRRACARPSASS